MTDSNPTNDLLLPPASDGGRDTDETGDLERLARLLARARALAGEGGLSPAARDDQKWAAGDLVAAMAKVVEAARDRLLDPGIPVDSHARAHVPRLLGRLRRLPGRTGADARDRSWTPP